MKDYIIEKVFDGLNQFLVLEEFKIEDDFENYLNNFIDIANPDFVAVLTTKSLNPILFQRNIRLHFENKSECTLETIIESQGKSYPEQLESIFKMDTEVFKFICDNSNLIVPEKNVYSVKFNTELVPGKSISLKRDAIVLSKDENGMPNVLLVAYYDVTCIFGNKKGLSVCVRDYSESAKKNEPTRLKLLEKLNSIISFEINLTKREKQILTLIAEGKTSEQIAEKLSISKYTVNTHRQNIINKNNINNTTAIIKDL